MSSQDHVIRILKPIQTLYQTKAKEKEENLLSIRTRRSINALKALCTCCESALLKTPQGHAADLAARLFELFGELSLEVTNALLKTFSPTIDRILKPIRFHYTKRGRSATSQGPSYLTNRGIKTNQWDEARPGFLEADTVAHPGDSTTGMYANTIDFVDIATGWTEQRAVSG